MNIFTILASLAKAFLDTLIEILAFLRDRLDDNPQTTLDFVYYN